ncbi:helix-turn-helix domain-containing protein [Saccharomonospora sp. NPDC006951]
MYSPEDRTAKAIIRDTAVELFGEHGVDAVPLRAVAQRCELSQPLIIKHYGSREGLVRAADEHVLGLLGNALDAAAQAKATGSGVVAALGDPVVTRYVLRLLTSPGKRASDAYARLHEFSKAAVRRLDEEGRVAADTDLDELATVLLAHDLSVLFLRARITEATGTDPLSPGGLASWTTTVARLYGGRALTSPDEVP